MIAEILVIVGIIIFTLSMIIPLFAIAYDKGVIKYFRLSIIGIILGGVMIFSALFLIGNVTSIKTKDVTYSVNDGYKIKKLRDGYVINGNGKDNYFVSDSDIEEVERTN